MTSGARIAQLRSDIASGYSLSSEQQRAVLRALDVIEAEHGFNAKPGGKAMQALSVALAAFDAAIGGER